MYNFPNTIISLDTFLCIMASLRRKNLVSMRLQECDVIRMRARTYKEVKEIPNLFCMRRRKLLNQIIGASTTESTAGK